jgi:hypothetical protein
LRAVVAVGWLHLQTNKTNKNKQTCKLAREQAKTQTSTKINYGCKIINNEFGQTLQACEH